MKITSVEVRRLFSFGQYENMTIGYTAEVEAGEHASDVRAYLTKRIEDEYAAYRGNVDVRNRLAEEAAILRSFDIPRLRREAEEIKGKIEAMKAFLVKHGVDIATDDLPF